MQLIRTLLIAALCLCSSQVSFADAFHTSQPLLHHLIFVRHADKADDGGLNKIGIQRANRLAEIIKDSGISRIYSTDYRRTLQTARPTANALGLSIQRYDATSTLVEEIKKYLMQSTAATTILIVGHSNTVPDLIYAFGGPTLPDIAESDFDNLFILSIEGSNTQLTRLHIPPFTKKP